VVDESGAHPFAYATSGAIWARAADLARLEVRLGRAIVASRSARANELAPYLLAPTLLADFFEGRPLPGPSARPRAIPPDAPARSASARRPAEPTPPDSGTPGPLAREPQFPLLGPTSADVRVRFLRGGPTWTATVFGCRGVDERIEDPGCGVLMLRSGEDRRYMLVDGQFDVAVPALQRVQRPDGGEALMLVEARGLQHHTDVWHAHLVEDEGSGPRLAFTLHLASCGDGDEEGFGCGMVGVRARYVDTDRDGDRDVVVTARASGRTSESASRLPTRTVLRDGAGYVRPPPYSSPYDDEAVGDE
jgi:hypothetical protein